MGHFNACDNRLITIMSKDRKDRKARTARARVSGPGFGPEKLEPDPDRGIYNHSHRSLTPTQKTDASVSMWGGGLSQTSRGLSRRGLFAVCQEY